jgi:hypothetical protein
MHDTDLLADYYIVLYGLLRELQLLCVSEIGSFLNLIFKCVAYNIYFFKGSV